mmetsp:Transcript_30706/g.86051  ORF Transcript_30706/g.86051 Transcript_30706/m.86051 type:complete len:390 (-) Transcript_30706:168-1337(-)
MADGEDVRRPGPVHLADKIPAELLHGGAHLVPIAHYDLHGLGHGRGGEGVGAGGEADARGRVQVQHLLVVRHNKAAVARHGLGEHAADEVAGADHVEVLLDAASGRSHGAERVGLVHHQRHVVLVADLPRAGEVRNGTVRRVDAVEHQQGAAGVLVPVLRHELGQRVVVVVREAHHLRARHLGTEPQADVRLLVDEDHAALGRQVEDQVHAAKEARGGNGAVLAAEERRQVGVGLLHRLVLAEKQVAAVVAHANLPRPRNRVVHHLLVHVEAPVRERAQQRALEVVALHLDRHSVVELVKVQSGRERPVLLDQRLVVSPHDVPRNIVARGQEALSRLDRQLLRQLHRAQRQLQERQVTVVLPLANLHRHVVILQLLLRHPHRLRHRQEQ